MTDEIQRQALARDIARRLQLASVDELRVLDRVLGRLELGRQRYGLLDLGADRRDWRRERFEERLDALVYDVCDELVLEDAARAGLREEARREMFTGVDRSATPESLQHVAEPKPFAEAVQDGLRKIRDKEYAARREMFGEFAVDQHATKIGGPDPYESVEVELEDPGGEGG